MVYKKQFIVVPEGLSKDLKEPSFIYRHVLDVLCQLVTTDDHIYLAPGNSFGGIKTEHEAALDYLHSKGFYNVSATNTPPSSSYIDTRENAQLLKEYLMSTNQWPLSRAYLIVYSIHARRAKLVFHQAGFFLEDTIKIESRFFPSEPIVPRLWYYRYPIFHRIYEILA